MLAFLRKHIAARLAAIWLVVAIPMTVVLVLTYFQWYQARFTVVEQERLGYAQSVATSFDLLLTQMRLAMRAAGGTVADGAGSSEIVTPALQGLVSSFPIAYAAFADSEGRILASSRPGLVGSSVATDTAFLGSMRAEDGGAVEPSEVATGGLVGFHVAQMIPARAGRRAGVMLMFVDVRKLDDSFPVKVPTGGISVVDAAGQVVFQNENPRFAENMAPWGDQFPFVREALNGQIGRSQDWQSPVGGTRIAVFVPIPGGWAAGSSVSPQEALAPFYRARLIGIPVVLVVAVLAALTSLGISRGIQRSLRLLGEEADRIGSGRLEEPVRIEREDEIGAVARSLERARTELLGARLRGERDLETNARLYEAERERARLERLIAEINADLVSSLDIEQTLPGVFEKARRELGAFAAGVVDRIEGGWQIRVLVGEAKVFKPGYVFKDELAPTLMRMLRTREPEIVADVHRFGLANLVVAELAGYEAYAGYPLLVRGEVVGALGMFFREPRALTEAESDFAQRFGFSVSLAEENSRLYRAQRGIAETLQSALLALPETIAGIDFAHYYASATEAARVGGDFYDLFQLEHNLVGITVGDIAGHGIDAAVLTSLVKNAIRVQATQQDRPPDEVVATASELLLANSPTEVFATVFFGLLYLDDGLLEYCNAGHTTGACVCSSQGVSKLPPNSPLIGAFPNETFELSSARLDPGDLVFLYTDGVTEARREGELFTEERLFELLDKEPGDDPHGAVQRVVDEVLRFANGRLSDDLAILAVKRD